MRKLNGILAAINLSPLDDEVIKRAVLVAKETGAQLHFVHAIHIPVLDIEITSKFLKEKINEEDIKRDIVQKIDTIKESKGLEYILHITVGDSAFQVIHTAKKIQTDLIIVGSHSKIKIEDYYLGTTANQIAQMSGLPILVIKNSVHGIYKNILAPTDLSISSKKSILFSQIAFKPSPIKLLFTYKDTDDLTMEFYELNDEKAKTVTLGRSHTNIFKEELGIKYIELIQSSLTLDESIIEYIKTKKCDLVILGSTGLDIAGSFLGSTTSYILRETKADVLIYIPLNQE